jgi:hypothetical protein
MSVATDSWRRIRRLRANPPLLAGNDLDPLRTQVFQAALTQAEELWEAASVVGAASRPLPLFYCLSQAGRAICASWATQADFEPNAHGLTSTTQPAGVQVPAFEVRKVRHGMFSMVADATVSAAFEGTTTVAALWAALPDLPNAPKITGTELRPIYVEGARVLGDQPRTPSALDFLQAPKAVLLSFPRPPQVPFTLGETPEALAAAICAALVDYPLAADAVVTIESVLTPLGNARTPVVRFPDSNGDSLPLSDVGDRLPRTGATGAFGATWVLRPRLGTGNGTPPSQLMILWALLFGLSTLARYHPALWVQALDPDSSEIAVDLEQGLDAALQLVPDLLVPALTNGAMPRLVRGYQAAEQDRARQQQEADQATDTN